MASADIGTIDCLQPGCRRCLQLAVKGRLLDVPSRLREEDQSAWLGSRAHLGKEPLGIGELVDYGEGKGEVDRAFQIGKPHGVGRSEASVHTIEKPLFGGAALQAVKHSGLDIYGDHAARTPDRTRQFERGSWPIPGPGSSTVMPSRMYPATIGCGFSHHRRHGQISQYPSHQGQTLCAIAV